MLHHLTIAPAFFADFDQRAEYIEGECRIGRNTNARCKATAKWLACPWNQGVRGQAATRDAGADARPEPSRPTLTNTAKARPHFPHCVRLPGYFWVAPLRRRPSSLHPLACVTNQVGANARQ